MAIKELTTDKLLRENEELKARLREAEETLDAIRNGGVDAIVVSGEQGNRIFSLTSAETPYRLLLEGIDEGAINTTEEGTILYCNNRFAEMINHPVARIVGSDIKTLVSGTDKVKFGKLFKKGLRGRANDVISFNLNDSRELIHLKLSITAAPSDTSGDICIVATDVTEMKTHQEKLKVLVEKKTKDLKKANEKLKEDILEIKRSGEALRESEERFRAAFVSGTIPMEIASTDSKIIKVNPAFCSMLGYSEAELVGHNFTEFTHPDDLLSNQAKAQYLFIDGQPFHMEKRYVRKDGTVVWADVNSAAVFDQNRKPLYVITHVQDITERKKIEEALKESEEKYRRIVETAGEGIIIASPEGIFQFVNQKFADMLGYSREEILGKNSNEFIYDKQYVAEIQNSRKYLRKGEIVQKEVKFRRNDGSLLWTLYNAIPLFDSQKNHIGNLAMHTDITERKKAEEELRKSEALYRAIGETIDYGIWICDADGKNIYASDSYLKLVGMTQEQCSEFGWGDKLHPDDAEGTIAAWKECSKTGGVWDIVHRFIGVDGKWHPILARGIPIRDDKGKIIMWAGINLDIGKIKETEDSLRKSEEKVRSILTNSLDIIYRINLRSGEYEFISPSVEHILGYSPDELMSLDVTASLAMVHPEDISILHAAQAQSEKTGTGVAEYRQRTKNGEYRWLSNHISFKKDSEGQPLYRDGNIRDITEQKKAGQIREQLMLEIERQAAWLNASISSMVTGIILYGMDGKATHMNETAKKLLPEELFFNATIEERSRIINWETEDGKLFTPEEIPVKRAFNGETTYNVVLGATFHDRKLWISTNAAPILATNGKLIGVVASFLDITENKNAEIALRLSEERLRVTLESIGDAVMTFDTLGKVVFLNPVATKLTGWNQEDAKGQPIEKVFRIIDELTLAPAENIVSKVLEEGKNQGLSNHTALISRDGTQIPIEDSAAPIKDADGNISGVVLVFHDVTEKRLAQEALRISEERFRNLVKYAPAVIYEMDLYGKRFYSVNDAMCEVLGYSREELLSLKPMELLEESSRDLFRERIKRKLNNQEIEEDVEYKVRKKDGNLIYALITVGNITFSDEVNPHITVVAYNITERRRKEEILRESEKRFRDLVKYAPAAIYEIEFASRRFTSVNDSMCKLSGYSREELMTVDALDLLDEDSRKLFLSRISKSLKGEKPDENVEYKVISKDGHIIYAVLNMKFNFNEKGLPIGAMVVGHDITERKKAEQSLIQSEERLKELIATKDKFFNIMAHDLKNPFTTIIGSSELLFKNIHKLTPENIKNLASLLNDSAKSGFSILQNLLDWSRSQTGLLNISSEKLNLKKLVAENISYQELSAKNKDINIIIESEGDIYLTTDRNMINTVFRNLLSNSIKFTQRSGKVIVSLRKESRNITIRVKDNGVGISPDRIGKLFNLETRNSTPGTENEQGTGLGLKLSKELIEKLGGNIYVESVLGSGSTFWIKLPEKFGDRLLNI